MTFSVRPALDLFIASVPGSTLHFQLRMIEPVLLGTQDSGMVLPLNAMSENPVVLLFIACHTRTAAEYSLVSCGAAAWLFHCVYALLQAPVTCFGLGVLASLLLAYSAAFLISETRTLSDLLSSSPFRTLHSVGAFITSNSKERSVPRQAGHAIE
jgi:hypothetical protein